MIEEWKPILYTNYEVSNIGNVRNIHTNRIKKLGLSSNGYLIFGAFKNSNRTNILVHRAVVEAFIGRIPIDKEVNHKDGNKHNNIMDNLEIVSKSENQKHAINIGLSDLTALQSSKRYKGDEHWTHIKPISLAKGDNNGSRKHPEKILKGEQCKSSKLTSNNVIKIRKQWANGELIQDIANEFKVSNRNIWYIVNNKSWRHLL